MRVTLTGASGLIGTRLVGALVGRGDDVTVLSRNPQRAGRRLGGAVQLRAWDPQREPAPPASLAGRDAVVHLAGEPIARRWSARAKREIRDSRVEGTRRLVQGLGACPEPQRPRALVSGSAIGYYGAHEDEPIDEEAPGGSDFLARVCAAWEAEAQAAERLGMRVVRLRTGVVLDPAGGALGKMLGPFELGVGGPVAGGEQYVAWIHPEDLVGIVLAAIEDERWRGPVNATAPRPVTNRELSKTLGRVLGRPAALPVPALALRLLYGEMAEIVTAGARVLPARALVLGYEFRHPDLEEALRSALAGGRGWQSSAHVWAAGGPSNLRDRRTAAPARRATAVASRSRAPRQAGDGTSNVRQKAGAPRRMRSMP